MRDLSAADNFCTTLYMPQAQIQLTWDAPRSANRDSLVLETKSRRRLARLAPPLHSDRGNRRRRSSRLRLIVASLQPPKLYGGGEHNLRHLGWGIQLTEHLRRCCSGRNLNSKFREMFWVC